MDTVVLAFFKQENLLYIKWHLSENLIATFESLLNPITLLTVQQTVSLKIIYDFRIEISFMEK